MSNAPVLSKGYEPAAVEAARYARWLEAGSFRADPESTKPPYSIVIPPPNVTGVLTMGHVLNNTIQDILCRKARMDGQEVLWLPGTDHAGLATQTAVEKALRKPADLPANVRAVLEADARLWDAAAGKPRVPLVRANIPRDALLALVWAWTRDRGGIIIQQLKKLGCSCDWERERFTMDEGYHRAVQQAFVDLYERGYIYRGKRMVNWCPASLTAISDEEVIATPQRSVLYTMRYEVAEEPGRFVEIATTRPETLMGDTGVAVNPGDARYRDLVGKHCWRPFPRAKIPIVADEQVDFEFGTGVLKVTPAHDRADFEIGRRHHLAIVDVLHADGRVNCPEVPELDGLDRFEARKKAAELLAAAGLLVKEEPYENNVGFSERGQVPIEPRLSEQWFLDYRRMLGGRMIEEALRVVRERSIRFHPERWEKVYAHWLENIQDWCLSRQVVWGHRIPVWHRHGEVRCQIESPGEGWEQDADCLDTWASSWLWAYATMDDVARRRFYPTSALVTGPDIIFLWVARMIIAGLEFEPSGSDRVEDNLAFRDVYFTGIIRDKQGRKMSKSLGNSPDPLDLIAKYGADGLRFGVMRIAPQGQDIRFDEQQMVEGRNFINKLWNACRFRLMQGAVDGAADPSRHELGAFAKWVLARWDVTLAAVDAAYAGFRFNEIAQRLYDFVWGDFCDWFIEVAKADFNEAGPRRDATLAVFDYVLRRVLLALHPVSPFVTEELWEAAGFGSGVLDFEAWPARDGAAERHADEAARVGQLCEAVTKARALRSAFNLPSNRRLAWRFRPAADWAAAEVGALASLLNAESVDVLPADAKPGREPAVLTAVGDLILPIEGVVDAAAERKRIGAQLEKARKDLAATQAKLGNPQFAEKVPPEVLEEHRTRAVTLGAAVAELEERLTLLGTGPG
jgi:valyl-tRNA synthetase